MIRPTFSPLVLEWNSDGANSSDTTKWVLTGSKSKISERGAPWEVTVPLNSGTTTEDLSTHKLFLLKERDPNESRYSTKPSSYLLEMKRKI